VRSARSSRQTGTTAWCRARARNWSLLGPGIAEGPKEARPVPGVAGAATLLLDLEQQDVAVAVVVGLTDPLALARRLALAPHLLAAAAPEHRAALGQRGSQRVLVHPRHHQDSTVDDVLHDGRHEPGRVVADPAQLLVGHGDRAGRGAGVRRG